MNARGRYGVSAGHSHVSPIKHFLGALLAASALAGCGGIDSPNLGAGQVLGKLTGAKPGAFVYALGHPETKVAVAGDGSYTISDVPVDSRQVVVFDGQQGIDIVDVEVKGASRSRAADRDAKDLKVASTILAAARPAGGVSPDKAQYQVEGVALRDDAVGAVASLFPIPPGKFKVRAQAAGLRDVPVDVDVAEAATVQVEIGMDVEDGDSRKGCIANGCSGELKCDGDSSGKGDGRCYQCTDSAQCGSGLKCSDHTCVPSNDGQKRSVCLPCTQSLECSPGPLAQPGACIPAGGGGSVCSHACTGDAECPSGLACTGNVCVALNGCTAVLQAFGQACIRDDGCSTALADAKCAELVRDGNKVTQAGYCSSRCGTDADCPTSLGFYCHSSLVCYRH